MAASKVQEIPRQDLEEIRRRILSKCRDGVAKKKDLFVDPTFPPDQTSLTYVYSGDDKYEKMVFTRPQELVVQPQLIGQGGVCEVWLPLTRWGSKHWLLYSLAIVSLNKRYLEKLIPGYKTFEQNFWKYYTGVFQFRLWRFGEWVDIIVDDYLPVLEDQLAYCPSMGSPPEFWAPLLEKAYAKINKAYETVENGNTLNALTDFSGSICERYKPERYSTLDLFQVIYKSSVNRSMVACWRNVKSFRESSFKTNRRFESSISCTLDMKSQSSQEIGYTQIFIVTAATKFPLRDGRMLEMLRLKNPCEAESMWQGEFSLKNESSWNSVNPTFMENYRPRDCLEANEFWISYLDYMRHFGELIICSSNEPYRGVETDTERRYKDESAEDLSDILYSLDKKLSANNMGTEKLDLPTLEPHLQKRGSIEIVVQESNKTVKVDTVEDEKLNNGKDDMLFIRRSRSAKENRKQTNSVDASKKYQTNSLRQMRNRVSSLKDEFGATVPVITRTPSSVRDSSGNQYSRKGSLQSSMSGHSHSTHSTHSSRQSGSGGATSLNHGTSIASNLSGISNYSNTSSVSDSESTYSTSEIRIKVNGCRQHWERLQSAPLLSQERKFSLRASSSQTSIFESRMDHFRSHGSWKEIVRHFGKWKKKASGGPRTDMTAHSKNPRVMFAITKSDAINEVVSSCLHGKSHVIVSVMQDYRQGAMTANSMLVNIGFALYKSKHAEKDVEKRNLSKLTLIGDVRSELESREVTARFDLDPGCYILVPYTCQLYQEGEFLVRVLGEKDQNAAKTGCVIA